MKAQSLLGGVCMPEGFLEELPALPQTEEMWDH